MIRFSGVVQFQMLLLKELLNAVEKIKWNI